MLVLGNELLLPLPAEINYEMPTGACMTDNGEMLVADSASARLVFTDSDMKVRRIESLNDASPLSRIMQVTGDGSYFYVRGVKYERNTSVIQSEKILRYDADGKNRTVLFEIESGRRNRFSSLYDCCVYEGKLYYVAEVPTDDIFSYHLAVYSVDISSETMHEPEPVFVSTVPYAYTSRYLPQKEQLYSTDFSGALFLETGNCCNKIETSGKTVRVFCPEKNGTIIYSDPVTWNVYIDDKVIAENVGAESISANQNYVLFDNEFDGSLMRYNRLSGETETIRSAGFSGPFGLLTALKFISVIYISAILLVLAVKFLIDAFEEKNYRLLKRLGIIAVGLIMAVAISGFYTRHIYQIKVDEIKEDVIVLSRFFAKTEDADDLSKTAELIDGLRNGKANLPELKDKIAKYDNYYGSFINSAEGKGSFCFVYLYARKGDSYFLSYDSMFHEQIGECFDYAPLTEKVMQNLNDASVSTIEGTETLFNVTPVYNSEGEIAGLVELGENFGVFKKQAAADSLELTMELLTAFVAVYLVLTEGRSLISGLKERRRRLALNNPNAELAAMRPLNFLFSLLTSFDGVILVLISREMLTAGEYPPNSITWLMALPSMAFSVGSPIGTVLYSALASRVPVKKLSVGSIVFMAACYVLIIPVIINNLFITFCILKFLSSIANSISYSMLSSMPYRTENENERYEATKDKALGGVSSSILGAMVGGLVSQKFGNISLYAVNAAAFLPLIILMLAVIPANCVYVKRNADKTVKSSLKDFGKFAFSVPMLSYFIFLTIPLMTAEGYKSYLFPLYSTAMDMPKMYVTNFYVFARVIMLIINEPVTKATKNIDYWKLSVFGMLAMSMAFMCFAVNSTIIWAIIMLLINAVLDKIVASSKAMMWPRQAKAAGLVIMETTSYMSIVERFIFSLKETILSAFLLLGNNAACTAVGIFCAVFTVLFALTTSTSAMAKGEAEQAAFKKYSE